MQHDFILLDRSGSMSSLWTEAINSVNGYVEKLAEDKVDTGVTLIAFDGSGGLDFKILRDRIIPSTWRKVAETEAPPRGMTPLNDAVGRLVSLAMSKTYDKVAIIIMTDGHENASREISHRAARNMLDECRAKGWQVIFLGANFDNAVQAESYGTMSGQHVNSTAGNLRSTTTALADKRALYASGASATMDFSDEEKLQARTDTKTDTKAKTP